MNKNLLSKEYWSIRMSRIAIIPARGGSKRIPWKNIKDFFGKPLISYSIEVAESSGLFDNIIVSTDSEEIANIAQKYGACVPFLRPAELADDFAITVDVMAHAVHWLQGDLGELSVVCCIYATAPFICKDDLIRAYDIFKTNRWSYVFSATSYPFPIQRSLKRLDEGGVGMFYPELVETRSQDLEEAYHDAGQFYFGKPQAWLNKQKVFGNHSEIIILPRWRVQDIDNEQDWRNAELIMETITNRK